MTIDELLKQAVNDEHFSRTVQFAARVIARRRKRRVLLLPLLVGIVVGTLGAWWLGVMWGLILASAAIDAEMRAVVNLIHLHQATRIASQMAVAIGEEMKCDVPVEIQRQAVASEWPPMEKF